MNDGAPGALRAQVKDVLRDRMRRIRHVLPPEAVAARSAKLCERLWALPEVQQASLIVGYRAIRKEIDVAALLALAERSGKRLGLPRVHDDGVLTLHAHHDGAKLAEGAFGIEEPPEGAEPIANDAAMVILVPALVLDVRGQRIGYGRGYYDRLLPRLTHAFKIGVSYDFQLAAELPSSEHDCAVDCVVTDARALRVGG